MRIEVLGDERGTVKSTLWEPNSELSINAELLSLLDVETMLTKSLETEERCHGRVLALSFVRMAIRALDENEVVQAAEVCMEVPLAPIVD